MVLAGKQRILSSIHPLRAEPLGPRGVRSGRPLRKTAVGVPQALGQHPRNVDHQPGEPLAVHLGEAVDVLIGKLQLGTFGPGANAGGPVFLVNETHLPK